MVDTPLQNEWFISEAAWAHGNWFCTSAVAYLVFRTSRPSRPMLVATLPSLAQLVPQYLQSRGHRHQTVAQRCTVKVIAVIFFFLFLGSHYWVKFSFFWRLLLLLLLSHFSRVRETSKSLVQGKQPAKKRLGLQPACPVTLGTLPGSFQFCGLFGQRCGPSSCVGTMFELLSDWHSWRFSVEGGFLDFYNTREKSAKCSNVPSDILHKW